MNKFVVSLPINKKVKNVDSSSNSNQIKSNNHNKKQMFLDYGQKSFGLTITCKKCEMLYVVGDNDDENKHKLFCKQVFCCIPSFSLLTSMYCLFSRQ